MNMSETNTQRRLCLWYAVSHQAHLIEQPLWWNCIGHELGALNEFQGHLGQLKRATRDIAQNAQSMNDWCVVAVLARIIAECTERHYDYIKIENV